MKRIVDLFTATFCISLTLTHAGAMDPTPTHKLVGIIKPKHASDDMFIFVKKVPDNRLIVFTKDGAGEVLDLSNGSTLYTFSTMIYHTPIHFQDVTLVVHKGTLVLAGFDDELNMYIYHLNTLYNHFQYASKTELSSPLPKSPSPITATHDQICNHEQPPLSDEIFDLTSLSTQQQEELISIWRTPDGQTMTGLKQICCYHKTVWGDIFCGHDWGRISVWTPIKKEIVS